MLDGVSPYEQLTLKVHSLEKLGKWAKNPIPEFRLYGFCVFDNDRPRVNVLRQVLTRRVKYFCCREEVLRLGQQGAERDLSQLGDQPLPGTLEGSW